MMAPEFLIHPGKEMKAFSPTKLMAWLLLACKQREVMVLTNVSGQKVWWQCHIVITCYSLEHTSNSLLQSDVKDLTMAKSSDSRIVGKFSFACRERELSTLTHTGCISWLSCFRVITVTTHVVGDEIQQVIVIIYHNSAISSYARWKVKGKRYNWNILFVQHGHDTVTVTLSALTL